MVAVDGVVDRHDVHLLQEVVGQAPQLVTRQEVPALVGAHAGDRLIHATTVGRRGAAEIDGKPVTIRPGTRQPHVVLRREGSRISGFAGCNNLTGVFQLDGASLRIGDKLAMTRMACPPPQSELEALFVAAVDKAQRLERDNTALVLIAEGQAPSRFLPFTPP